MTSILKVDNIQNSSGTSALSIDSSGIIKPTASGAVIAIRHYSNSTRTAMSLTGSSGTIWSFTDTKVGGTETDIIVQINIIGKDDGSGSLGTYIEYGGSRSYSAAFQYESSPYLKPMTGSMKATGKASGSQTVTIGWDAANNATTYPFVVLNPNSTDDARNHQFVSTVTVYEVMA